jgi:hypothetical protein
VHGETAIHSKTGTLIMMLIFAFAIAVFVGDVAVFAVCSLIEQFSKQASLIAFLFLFMAVFPVAWKVAVRVTEPKTPTGQSAA